MIHGDQNIGEGFVVAHQHVEARLQLLDEIRFQKQRVGFGLDRDEHHRRRRRDHPRDAVHMTREARIARDPLADVFRLADVEHLAVFGDHAIDAGTVGRVAPMLLDDVDAALDAFGRLGRLDRTLRTARASASVSAMSKTSSSCGGRSRGFVSRGVIDLDLFAASGDGKSRSTRGRSKDLCRISTRPAFARRGALRAPEPLARLLQSLGCDDQGTECRRRGSPLARSFFRRWRLGWPPFLCSANAGSRKFRRPSISFRPASRRYC